MPCPEPPSALDGRCSVVYNNTIYVYTPTALLSLPIKQGAKWNSTDSGEPVTDAVCVVGSIDGSPDNQGLYVVGGTSNNSTYSGLQRYLFSERKWETVSLGFPYIQNRVNHSAIYLPGTASILVYAGSQTSNQDASTTTFEIPVKSPVLLNRPGNIAAGIKPTLLPWDDATAVYVGGTPTNTEVFLYHGDSGWGTSQISLAQGIPSDAGVAIQSNPDGSKFLEIFDMTVSPNNVTYVALLQTGGSPAYPGQPVNFTTSSSTKKRKRDWGNVPSYNGTLASSITRSSFSLAQSDDGLVIISGGSNTDPLTVFNQTQNSWLNTTKLFFSDEVSAGLQQPLTPSSTTTAPTTSATATTTTAASASSTTTTAAAASGGSRIGTGVIIGATLGCLLGVAAILVILLIVLRHLHRRNGGSIGKSSRRYGSQDKDRLSFQDRGIEPLTMAAVPMARSNVPSAVDSLNMISGKFTNDPPSASLADKNQATTRSLVPPARSPLITIASSRIDQHMNDSLTPTNEPGHSRGDRSTDEGWGKYFQDGAAEGLTTDSPRTTMNSDISQVTKSDYRGSMWPHEVPERTTIALSALDGPRPLGQVPSGSPSAEHLPSYGGQHIHQAQAAHISTADSSSFISDLEDEHDRHDGFSSGIPQSVHDGTSWVHQPYNLRPSSSVHESIVDARSHERRSSGILHHNLDGYPPTNVNSDMSWLNLHADK
ncbi:conserved hypothetical protein [Talaromyces stipitatus ATCC 10500]|uniref:Pre-mRNA splicing factor Clf1 n=1 Tax=Talaromyces stipitatus (strain ATCC 10500 / CBS 375.48 / QM 6759 / NRRL 1006) TaxID=441959 RepID=B8LW39_TALSN|nr:uncharacterized protein TSTA_074450 [Talaromyces stipitatus ATCC 10500]EED24067.1 conserved hypothetical protein [Talaromyces stipitatus ATCC 10500]